jgi:hypothetical protein
MIMWVRDDSRFRFQGKRRVVTAVRYHLALSSIDWLASCKLVENRYIIKNDLLLTKHTNHTHTDRITSQDDGGAGQRG